MRRKQKLDQGGGGGLRRRIGRGGMGRGAMERGWAGVPVQSAMEAIRIEPRLDAWLSELHDRDGTDMLLTR